MRAPESKRQSWLSRIDPIHGIVKREDLLTRGLTPSAISRRMRSGELNEIHKSVYLVAGHALTWRSRIVAATLASEGYASHRCAAALWQLPCGDRVVEVTTERRRHATNVIWHKGSLRACDITTIDRIPVTGIHRTLLDLGTVVGREALEDAVDDAIGRKLTSAQWLEKEIARVGAQGRKGPSALAAVLAAGDDRPPSWLERRFIRLLATATLPTYQREYPTLGYRLDFAWPHALLAVEVHGDKWHRKRLRWAKDSSVTTD